MKVKTLRGRVAGTLALGALATLVTGALPAAPAGAATARCTLRISASFEYQLVKYNRVTNTCTPADTRDRMVQSIMWGADWPDGDDFRYSRSPVLLNETYTVQTVLLNEDRATGDEVYTENRFVRPNGSIYTVESNEVHGDFWPF
ncbi:hypothetical protein [Actinomadura rugatobispora]|nr:hypothetical protein GCM10010200_034810 [Actinomadura rugatobispora]